MADELDLTATSWTVTELAGAPVLEVGAPTVTFDAEGRITGSGGVNRFHASFEHSETSVSFGPVAATKMAGSPDLMEQEHRFFAVLEAASTLARAGDSLTLSGTSDDGIDVSVQLVQAPDEPTEPSAGEPSGVVELCGTVSYRERVALPDRATVTVTLEDVSLADAPSTTIAETSFQPAGQVPVDFELTAPADIVADTTRRLGLRARIEVEGTLAWTTDTHHPVDATTVDDRHDLWLVDARGA